VPKIIKLDSHVADLIAAGEVVERPASVVKELVENSIDAGAGIVTVEISSGGLTFIRITDNGCGIAPEDVKTAFLRHATSKLRSADGLESIGTLGFRGEALAAIAAVSRIELVTRETGAAEGVSLLLEAGEVVKMTPTGCPEGTTIIIRDLFFNTPARLKFMKSDRAEGTAVSSAVLRAALARPDVSVRYIKDGKTEYHTPGDSRVDSCIYSLFGREFAAGLLNVESADATVSVSGFVSSPDSARGNRSYQYFFVNGRPIRSFTLQTALEKAFSNLLSSGRFPACALYISTRLGDVDVNVHPAKTEVKFVSDKQIFDGVYYGVLSALERISPAASRTPARPAGSSGSSPTPGTAPSHSPAANTAITTNPATPEGQASQPKRTGSPYTSSPSSSSYSAFPGSRSGGFKSMQVEEYRRKYSGKSGSENSFEQGFNLKPQTEIEVEPDSDSDHSHPTAGSLFDTAPSPAPDMSSGADTNQYHSRPFRVIGEALNTYIIAEYQGSIWFIDKHAAHERLHFNALKSESFEPMSQALITPVVCRLGVEDASLMLENNELLEKLGFDAESFGEDSIAVRRIPSEIEIEDAEPVLSDICAQLKTSGGADIAGLDKIYQMIACKASIKAGRHSERREMEILADKVFSGEASHCPHGRPVSFEITKKQLDKGFKRI